MLSIINSSNLIGINGYLIKIEIDITNGIPSFNIVGLASTEIKESRERVKSAIINSGYRFPNSRIVVNRRTFFRWKASKGKGNTSNYNRG